MANVTVGSVEVSANDMIIFMQKMQTVSFSGADILVLAEMVNEYKGSLPVDSIKKTLGATGVSFV